MPANRLFKRSVTVIAAAMLVTIALPASAQEDAAYQEAQRLLRVDQPDAARAALAPVLSSGDEVWQIIGRSLQALVDGDVDGARASAQQAVDRNGDSPWTHFQLGLVASRQNDWALAASALDRTTQLNGDIAYAHYYAGLAFQRLRQSAKAGEHLNAFLRLAPEAPERSAVLAIVRTLG